MAQHDYDIANQTGLSFRLELNNALSAIVTDNSGPVEPTVTFPGMVWRDTSVSPSVLKKRNDANSGWVTTLTSFGEAISGASSVAAQRAALGLDTSMFSIANSGGTADAITASFSPVITLTNGRTVIVRAGAANTSTTPTFSPDGLVAKTIVKGNNLALAVGDIAGAAHWIEMQFDAVLDKWVLQNPAKGVSISGGGGASDAIDVTYTPTAPLESTNVQEAIDELAEEKVQISDLSAATGSNTVGFVASGSGAVTRTLQNKSRDWISVKDFGATGDGTTNDTAAIQAAATAASGKTLFFPAGNYKVVNGFNFTGDNSCIVGFGATLLYQITSQTYYHCIRISGNNLLIDGINIKSPSGLTRNQTGFGISVGIVGTPTSNVRISNVYIEGVASNGIWFSAVSDAIVTGCIIKECLAGGVQFSDGCYGAVCSNNIFLNNEDDNIALVNDTAGDPYVGHFSVTGNIIYGGAITGHGVALIGAVGGVVSGNTIEKTVGAGIGTYTWTDPSYYADRLLITNNKITDCGYGGVIFGGCGISLKQNNNVVVSGNYISNIRYDNTKINGAIYCEIGDVVTIQDNTLMDNSGMGVRAIDANQLIITGNVFDNTAVNPVHVSSAVNECIVKDNVFTNTIATDDIYINLPSGIVTVDKNHCEKAINVTGSTLLRDYNEVLSYPVSPIAQSGTLTTASGTLKYKYQGNSILVTLTVSITNSGSGSGYIYMSHPLGSAINGILAGRELLVLGIGVTAQFSGGVIYVYPYNNSTNLCVTGSSFSLSGVITL